MVATPAGGAPARPLARAESLTAGPLVMLDILNLESLEALARERLDPMLFDYIAGGAGDEWTLKENREAFSRVQLLPRMLRGVGRRDQRTTVLGTPSGYVVT